MTLPSSSSRFAGTKCGWAVEAPKEVPVHRREVYDAIKRNETTRDKDAASEAGTAET